jgi:hypothetical protein
MCIHTRPNADSGLLAACFTYYQNISFSFSFIQVRIYYSFEICVHEKLEYFIYSTLPIVYIIGLLCLIRFDSIRFQFSDAHTRTLRYCIEISRRSTTIQRTITVIFAKPPSPNTYENENRYVSKSSDYRCLSVCPYTGST